jgi:hypothetical protein
VQAKEVGTSFARWLGKWFSKDRPKPPEVTAQLPGTVNLTVINLPPAGFSSDRITNSFRIHLPRIEIPIIDSEQIAKEDVRITRKLELNDDALARFWKLVVDREVPEALHSVELEPDPLTGKRRYADVFAFPPYEGERRRPDFGLRYKVDLYESERPEWKQEDRPRFLRHAVRY